MKWLFHSPPLYPVCPSQPLTKTQGCVFLQCIAFRANYPRDTKAREKSWIFKFENNVSFIYWSDLCVVREPQRPLLYGLFMLFKYQTRIYCVLVIHNLYLCQICSTNIAVITTDTTEYYFKKILHTLFESFCQWHFMGDRLLAHIYIFVFLSLWFQ